MRILSIMIACLVLIAVPAFARSTGDQLKALRNKARPLVILSDSRQDPRVAKQISSLDGTKPELDDRNIAILREAQTGSALRKTLGVSERGFAVVLVGKDGGVKKVWRDPVDPKAIFTIIDAMPMRQREMKG